MLRNNLINPTCTKARSLKQRHSEQLDSFDDERTALIKNHLTAVINHRKMGFWQTIEQRGDGGGGLRALAHLGVSAAA
jgi:hypothetical protein